MSESNETFDQKLWRFMSKIATVLDFSQEMHRISDLFLGAPEDMADYLAARKRLAEVEATITEKCTAKFFPNNPIRDSAITQPATQVNDWEELIVTWGEIFAACDSPGQFTERYHEFLAARDF